MSAKKPSRPVKEFWWECNDLHVIFADTGEKVIYKNANVTKMYDSLKGTGIKGTPMTFESRGKK